MSVFADDDVGTRCGSTGCGEVPAVKHTGKTMTETMKEHEAMSDHPPKQPCKNTNAVQVRLSNFAPSKDTIVADIGAMLSRVNVAQPKPAGCMSGTDDPDCIGLFPSLGLSLKTGARSHAGCSRSTRLMTNTATVM